MGLTLPIVARLLLYAGALIVIGQVVLERLSDARGPAFSAARDIGDARRWSIGAWTLVLLAALLLFVAQFLALELAPTAADVAMLVRQTTWGHAWAVLTICGVAGAVAASVRAALAVRVAIAVGLGIAMSGLGHAAADASPGVARTLDTLHVLAIGAWLGTLGVLSVVGNHGARAFDWARYSRLATVAAPLTVLTGVGSAFRRVGEQPIATILAGDYGRLLLGKITLVAVTLIVGAWHRQRVQAGGAPTATSVRLELVLAVLVLAGTAILTGVSPEG